ncbi:MAG: FGGY family carbohydrate kinase [Acidobacteria bacterium]|nr:FGGY family carbohydrate kinase [Acidobacteriota bacterium]MDW7983845.1 FGGY family carbohydrate kinase [Acidobacteriota bacterium]
MRHPSTPLPTPSTDMGPLVAGIDLGTEGVRVCVLDLQGTLYAEAAEPIVTYETEAGGVEQDPLDWWAALGRCLRSIGTRVDTRSIRALAVTSTSGTFVVLDARGRPLRRALMYYDVRATQEAREILTAVGGLTFVRPTDPLPKLLWLQRHEPDVWAQTCRVVHAADFVTGRLTGRWVTDWTHALKTGHDPVRQVWSPALSVVGIDPERLPVVVPPGTPIGWVDARGAEWTGLRRGTLVVAGMTDGCAAQVAAGAVAPGEWCSVLGTTLVVRGVTEEPLRDPQGRVYCHRHPEGFWLPGGASNTGGECLRKAFGHADLQAMDEQARACSPTGLIAYPLVRHGERFPFIAPQAQGFLLGTPRSEFERYAAYLEGVAYVERLAYDLLTRLGATVGDMVYTAGGGSRSEVWLQIRSDVLGRALVRPRYLGAAVGAAILAATAVVGDGLIARTRSMVRVDRTVVPRPHTQDLYTEAYTRFIEALRARGYLE